MEEDDGFQIVLEEHVRGEDEEPFDEASVEERNEQLGMPSLAAHEDELAEFTCASSTRTPTKVVVDSFGASSFSTTASNNLSSYRSSLHDAFWSMQQEQVKMPWEFDPFANLKEFPNRYVRSFVNLFPFRSPNRFQAKSTLEEA